MARLLGKERAVILATGTLANHLAVRIQAGVAAERGIELPAPAPNLQGFILVANVTLARRPVSDTVRAFHEAVGA